MTQPPQNFEMHESPSSDSLRLSLTGDLDLGSVLILADRLAPLRAKKRPVRLDLSELEFIDSTGIRLLTETVGEARIKGWLFQIEPDVRPQVMRMFRLVHLDHFILGA